MVSCAYWESVGFGKVVRASVPDLVTWEVTTSDTPGDIVVLGMSELASTPGLVAVECLLCASVREAFGVVL